MGPLLGIEYVLPCKPIVHVVHVAPLADIRAARLCEARSLHDGECSHTAEYRGRLGVEELHVLMANLLDNLVLMQPGGRTSGVFLVGCALHREAMRAGRLAEASQLVSLPLIGRRQVLETLGDDDH